MKKIISIVLCLFSITVFAVPREIIIVRHGDKWHKAPGQFLSPKGQIRAEQFALYYLSHYPRPDYIFASKPAELDNFSESHSFRPLQTVAPLANELSKQDGRNFTVLFPYYQMEYPKLVKLLLQDKQYDQKLILICWQHGRINKMAHELGVKQTIPVWAHPNYDMVYILKYDSHGKLDSFQMLKNQYPVKIDPTWAELARQA